MRELNAAASNCSMREIPLRPANSECQVSSVPFPTEVSRPTPVTTTLRGKMCSGDLLLLRFDVIDSVFDGGDLFGVFVGNVDVEGFLEGHHEFHDIERVRAEIIDEGGGIVHLAFVHPQLLNNDLLHPLFNRHVCSV